MILLLELGNSCLKAAYYEDKRMEFLGSVNALSSVDRDISEIFDIENRKVQSVFMASVGDTMIESRLINQVKQEFGIITNVLTTQPSCCDVECGYIDFKTLGVDRWMAILGAASYSDNPVIVVDAGTAITIDVVLDKKHIGGFIVPGLELMRASLVNATQNLSGESLENTSVSFLGTNTNNAVFGGTLFMAAAFLNQVVENIEIETGKKFDYIGTGGNFISILPLLEYEFDYIEDLTLVGMTKVLESV